MAGQLPRTHGWLAGMSAMDDDDDEEAPTGEEVSDTESMFGGSDTSEMTSCFSIPDSGSDFDCLEAEDVINRFTLSENVRAPLEQLCSFWANRGGHPDVWEAHPQFVQIDYRVQGVQQVRVQVWHRH